jgi:uncharacterized protein UPF0164
VVAVLVGAGDLGAQVTLRPGELLVAPATARVEALAGAGTALVGDEGSVFVNPAGMAPIRRTTIGGSAALGPGGSRFASAAGVLRIGRFDVGLGAMARAYGDTVTIDLPTGPQTVQGSNLSSWAAMGVVAAAYRRGILSAGASLKGLREYVSDSAAQRYGSAAVTGDVGLAVTVFDIMALGAAIQNVGGTFTDTAGGGLPLPRTVRIGYLLSIVDPQGTARLSITTDWIRPPGGDSWWALGAEGGVVLHGRGVLARAGYAAGRTGSDRRAPAFGAGLVLGAVRVDYSYQDWHTTSEPTHRLGVRWAL